MATLQQRYCFAREDGKLNLIMQSITTGTQLGVLVTMFVLPPEFALLVVAAAQTIASTVGATAWLFVASRQLGGLGMGKVNRLWIKLIVASLVAAVPTFFAGHAIDAAGNGAWMGHAGGTFVGGVLFVAIFLVMAKLLCIDEVMGLVRPMVRKVARRG